MGSTVNLVQALNLIGPINFGMEYKVPICTVLKLR